jgi:hypothetical protein
MATDFRLDPETWDLDTTGGDLNLISDAEEVIQAAGIAIMSIYGEWKFNPVTGIRWFSGMFDIQTPHIQKLSWIRLAILGVSGVQEVSEVSLALDDQNRGGVISYRAKTIYGPIAGEVTVQNGDN